MAIEDTEETNDDAIERLESERGVGDASTEPARHALRAFSLLCVWLTKPGTSRKLTRFEQRGGVWHIALAAGGYVYESATQRTPGGAIRNVLQVAAFDEAT